MDRLTGASENRRCGNCDAPVTEGFRRVYGAVSGEAERCPKCDTWRRLSRGSAAGRDVGVPDPEVSVGRHGGVPAAETGRATLDD